MDDSKMKKNDSSLKDKGGFFILTAVLLVLLCALLYPVFAPENVQFSNDGPYGVISSDTWKLPQTAQDEWPAAVFQIIPILLKIKSKKFRHFSLTFPAGAATINLE